MNTTMFDRLDVQSAEAKVTSGHVELVMQVFVEGQPAAMLPIRLLMDPAVAYDLAIQMRAVAAKRLIAGAASSFCAR